MLTPQIMINLASILFLITMGALVVVLCRAYLDGLAKARDPAFRVTLQSPWKRFYSSFNFKLDKRTKQALPLVMLLGVLVVGIFIHMIFFLNSNRVSFWATFDQIEDEFISGVLYLFAGVTVLNIFCSIW